MAKAKSRFVCRDCGAVYPKWQGQCHECGAWNTLEEEAAPVAPPRAGKGGGYAGVAAGQVQRLDAVELQAETLVPSGISEFDRVLGGGLVRGSVVLIGGDPGIGKSTLLLQTVHHLAQSMPCLYVSGEESVSQVKLRAERLGAVDSENLQLASSNSAEDIAASIQTGQYNLVIVDSIQTLSLAEISSAPGSVSQITNSSNVIIRAAKAANTAVILVGHVTKEGSIAGPKVLEHLVDVVLNFEGDRYGGFRVVRAQKNRYGSTNEAAIFEMHEDGLRIVANPSASLLAERQNLDGSIVLATMEGARPLLVEIQALVNPTNFGYPKRAASGFDLNRLNLLVAVLEKRTKLNLSDKDIYINVVGGLKLSDPAADLAVAMAIASASAGRKLSGEAVVFGEVGLGGEVRSAQGWHARVKEAKKLGFTYAIAPKTHKDVFVRGVGDLRQALIDYLQ